MLLMFMPFLKGVSWVAAVARPLLRKNDVLNLNNWDQEFHLHRLLDGLGLSPASNITAVQFLLLASILNSNCSVMWLILLFIDQKTPENLFTGKSFHFKTKLSTASK